MRAEFPYLGYIHYSLARLYLGQVTIGGVASNQPLVTVAT
jgi:hypothetical protein